jgi:hyperosmotically inducible periplasmic protein
MNTLKILRLSRISMLLVVGLSACDSKNSEESTRNNMGQTTDEIKNKMGMALKEGTGKSDDQGAINTVSTADTAITAKVNSAIATDAVLKAFQVSVNTQNGIVTLSGEVDSQSNSDKAKALTAGISDVAGVENQLTLKPLK